MSDRSTGIVTRNPTDYVATQDASEQAESHSRVIQIISMTAGKIASGTNSLSRLGVTINDAMDVSSVTATMVAGDNSRLACYVQHSQSNGSCIVTPLLCDATGDPIGTLEPKVSRVMVPVINAGQYLSVCLDWSIMNTGAWYLYFNISQISSGNSVNLYAYTF